MANSVLKRRLKHYHKPWATQQRVLDEGSTKRFSRKHETAIQKNICTENKHTERINTTEPLRGGTMPVVQVTFDDRSKRSPVSSLSCLSQESRVISSHQDHGQNSWINLWNEWGEVSKEGTNLTKTTTDSYVSSLSDSASISESSSQHEYELLDEIPYGYDGIHENMYSTTGSREACIPKEISVCVSIARNSAFPQQNQPFSQISSSFLAQLDPPLPLEPEKQKKNSVSLLKQFRPFSESPSVNSFKKLEKKCKDLHQVDASKRKDTQHENSAKLLEDEGVNLLARKESLFKDVKKHVRRRPLKSELDVKMHPITGKESIKKESLEQKSNFILPPQDLDHKFMYEDINGGVEVLMVKKAPTPTRQDLICGLKTKASENGHKHRSNKKNGLRSLAVALAGRLKKMTVSSGPPNILCMRINSANDDALSSVSSKSTGNYCFIADDRSADQNTAHGIAFAIAANGSESRHFRQALKSDNAHRINLSNPEELEVEYRRREATARSTDLWDSNQMFVHDLEGDDLGFLEGTMLSGKSSF